MITTKTKICAVIGKPVSHSLTPAMQNAAFTSLNLDYSFVAFSPENIDVSLRGLKSLGVIAIAVTLPFKVEALTYVDSIDESAKAIGATNAILLEHNAYVAYNFDGKAAVAALRESTGVEHKTIAIIGAGGAARAIAYELSKLYNRILIFNRSKDHAQKIVEDFHLAGSHGLGHTELISECDIVINTTPVGMTGFLTDQLIDASAIQKNQLIFDIVYSPKDTHMIKIAKEKGAKIVYGYKMLLYGGALLFEKITGEKAPITIMEQELLKQLETV